MVSGNVLREIHWRGKKFISILLSNYLELLKLWLEPLFPEPLPCGSQGGWELCVPSSMASVVLEVLAVRMVSLSPDKDGVFHGSEMQVFIGCHHLLANFNLGGLRIRDFLTRNEENILQNFRNLPYFSGIPLRVERVISRSNQMEWLQDTPKEGCYTDTLMLFPMQNF